jgi:hypothetical protein
MNGMNSNVYSEHTIFLIKSYFGNVERQENGEWKYSIQA